jgi:hypothetical protein
MSLYIQKSSLESAVANLNHSGFTVTTSKQDPENKEYLTLYFHASQKPEQYKVTPKKITNIYVKKETNNWFSRLIPVKSH